MSPQEAWATLSPLLERALQDGLSLAEVKARIEDGSAQFWPAERSCGVSEVVGHKDFHMWLVGGDLDELLNMHASAEAHAKAWGCDRITVIGRKGWNKALEPFGYRAMLVKEL